MKKTLTLLALIILSATVTFAQEPDRWHGLALDQSTVDDAVKSLGAAKDDSTRAGMRTLKYKKIAGMKEVILGFKYGKLVSILLRPEQKINADALPNIYGIKFTPKFSGISEAMNPRDYERHEGKVYAKTYPTVYELRAETERSRVQCLIDNGSFGAILKNGTGIRDEGGFPGRVTLIVLASRTLDDTKGADMLK
jgi:hypothetical protein